MSWSGRSFSLFSDDLSRMGPRSQSRTLAGSIKVITASVLHLAREVENLAEGHTASGQDGLAMNPGIAVSRGSPRSSSSATTCSVTSFLPTSTFACACGHTCARACSFVCLCARCAGVCRVCLCLEESNVSQQLSGRRLPNPQSNCRARVTLRVAVCLGMRVRPWRSPCDIGQPRCAAGHGLLS